MADKRKTRNDKTGEDGCSLKSDLPSSQFPSTELETEGYDCDFVEQFPEKFQCSICLLCLRDPCQTSCGHRFCRSCILRWLRSKGYRCPEDQQPLDEESVFPDNFAKREIESLLIRCPFKSNGCNEEYQLRSNKVHMNVCKFRLELCPQGCGESVTKENFEEHIHQTCKRHLIECKYCLHLVERESIKGHIKECPLRPYPCPLCQKLLTNEQQLRHVETDCQKAMVFCMFHQLGCDQTMERHELALHMQESTQKHLRLLCTATSALQEQVHNLSPPGHSVKASQPPSPLSKLMGLALKSPTAADNPEYMAKPSVSGAGLSLPLPAEATQQFSPTVVELNELARKTVRLEQENREMQLKVQSMSVLMAQTQAELTSARSQLSTLDARCCNGTFYWQVKNFSTINPVEHSSGFYTSYHGYKLCLRINVSHSRAPAATLSIFVHFLKSENDTLLAWPFSGRIVFTIVDQDDDAARRENIVEPLVADSKLEAFQRPTTRRNPKGFGFLDLVSLACLGTRNYLLHDTLLLKVTVIPSTTA
ncbi:PREDICTED: TNF receptor-associated factor 6-like [Priapulus caudatus]|uniref:TNF receptor-associated factor 6-like n=1 Tax=Priapulus caudatus TaxID=37621 RepID=A0ABM1EHM0_PRICU|nr:PREDICTED: TNF receptor-associated factor 6-like [Priapulus caudatus]XP_014671691.1 PREDICTED: TNF receptor-associated factor 6-like [Priapulus caudatus]XP_014671692.1 PREDICTED: TNF receptor-associated factor 6-like [Priapulus caudatus]XP_014671693.1 PREDICTED: TNF receptor-associated factor 6-like [Priapulus caudatus]